MEFGKIFTSSRMRTKLRFMLLINAHDEQKELRSDELDTLRRSRNPTVVLTANGEDHTNEEAQENVHDLNLFVTVQLLEETLAVTYRVGNSAKTTDIPMGGSAVEKPRLTKEEKTISCKTDNFVPLVVPALSTSSRGNSSSTSPSPGFVNKSSSRAK